MSPANATTVRRWTDRSASRAATVRPRGHPGCRDEGTTLVELLVTLLVTAIALSIVLPFVTAAGTASTTTTSVTTATAAARLALQSIEVEVGSASQICLPTSAAVASPGDSCTGGGTGAAVRVDSCAFGVQQWVQWQVLGGVLEEQTWTPVASGPVAPSPWNPVAASIVSPLPFSLTTAASSTTTSSPTTTTTSPTTSTTSTTSPAAPVAPTVLDVSLTVSSGHGPGSVAVPVSSSIAALDTQYSTPPGATC